MIHRSGGVLIKNYYNNAADLTDNLYASKRGTAGFRDHWNLPEADWEQKNIVYRDLHIQSSSQTFALLRLQSTSTLRNVWFKQSHHWNEFWLDNKSPKAVEFFYSLNLYKPSTYNTVLIKLKKCESQVYDFRSILLIKLFHQACR